jgi:hypothetical protein
MKSLKIPKELSKAVLEKGQTLYISLIMKYEINMFIQYQNAAILKLNFIVLH